VYLAPALLWGWFNEPPSVNRLLGPLRGCPCTLSCSRLGRSAEVGEWVRSPLLPDRPLPATVRRPCSR